LKVELSSPTLLVQADAEQLARFAADRIAERIRRAISARGEAVVALPGGTTPRAALEVLATIAGIEWAKVVLVPGDERFVDVADPDSNEGMIRAALVDRIEGPRPIVAGWEVEEGLGPEIVASRFEARLLGIVPKVDGRFRFDWIGLGMGPDGHTASLFPGREYPDDALVLATVHPSGQTRLTLGPELIRSAGGLAFLLEGEAKAATLRRVIEGEYDPVALPAQLIARRVPRCEVWCDQAAAASLSTGHEA
jgi:6-phosphogluconolactonase